MNLGLSPVLKNGRHGIMKSPNQFMVNYVRLNYNYVIGNEIGGLAK
jgi:hypothetical protein